MKEINKIVESVSEPNVNNLWIKNNFILNYTDRGWELLNKPLNVNFLYKAVFSVGNKANHSDLLKIKTAIIKNLPINMHYYNDVGDCFVCNLIYGSFSKSKNEIVLDLHNYDVLYRFEINLNKDTVYLSYIKNTNISRSNSSVCSTANKDSTENK